MSVCGSVSNRSFDKTISHFALYMFIYLYLGAEGKDGTPTVSGAAGTILMHHSCKRTKADEEFLMVSTTLLFESH